MRARPAPRPWSEDQFSKIVKQNITIAGVLRDLRSYYGPFRGNPYWSIHREVERLGLDVSHWMGQSHGTSNTQPLNSILVENGKGKPPKDRLIRLGLLKNECSICGLYPEWNTSPLTMILDHINGRNTDHRLGNLRLVCPNCNSQLPTFCGRNKLKHNIEREGLARPPKGKIRWGTGLVPDEVFLDHQDGKRHNVRYYILHWKSLPENCGICSLTSSWNGSPLTLHLDHKNGKCDDDRLSNLWFLCPNCHIQTPNFCRRNHKAI